MALYTSVGTRRRRAIVAVVLAALVAFGFGWLIGRQQVPSVDQRVADVRVAATSIATGIERLDIEYEQVLNGGDTAEGGVIEPLGGLRTDLIGTMDDDPGSPAPHERHCSTLWPPSSRPSRQVRPSTRSAAALTEAAAQVRQAFALE